MTVEGLQLEFADLSSQRSGQRSWALVPVQKRLELVRRVRNELARRSVELAATINRPVAETLVAEVLPALEAMRFLEENAEAILAPRRPAGTRPVWLHGVELEVRREPLGIVLVIGPANYPFFLPAVHAMQALVAGNAVMVKPGRDGWAPMEFLTAALARAGVDMRLFRLLGESPSKAQEAIAAGVDKVVLTGSNETGYKVMVQLAKHGVPSVMELSGNDNVFVLDGADLDRVVSALAFATALNGGNTCIVPRRVFAPERLTPELVSRLRGAGIELSVLPFANEEQVINWTEGSGHGLGATVFGPVRQAKRFATRIRVGTVVINDAIVPTADPRLPFGGRGKSGYGVTRGAEGLLELTHAKAIAIRKSRWLPHLRPGHPGDTDLFADFIAWAHGGSAGWRRIVALRKLLRTAMRRSKT